MSLRKSPTRTPALLAAIRSNVRKSTGPRTYRGKLRSAANALANGSRSDDLRQRLLKGRDSEAVACYDRIYAAICDCFQPTARQEWRKAAELARSAWANVWAGVPARSRSLRLALRGEGVDVRSVFRRHFRIEAPDGLRLNFWLARRSGARWLRIRSSRRWPKQPRGLEQERRSKASLPVPKRPTSLPPIEVSNELGMYFKIGEMRLFIPPQFEFQVVRAPNEVGMFLQLKDLRAFIPRNCPALFVDSRRGITVTLEQLEEALRVDDERQQAADPVPGPAAPGQAPDDPTSVPGEETATAAPTDGGEV
jgi:hypothetical protein